MHPLYLERESGDLVSSDASCPDQTGSAQPSRRLLGSPSPAYAGDAGDPDPLYSNGTYYAFTTGTPAGNFIQALTSTVGPTSGWQPYTGGSGSSALPNPPGWETTNTQTSPGVFFYGGHWVMFYDASANGAPADSGHSCISVATLVCTRHSARPSATPTSCQRRGEPPGADPSS
jgi:hypothetical protein